ncbi:MAG: 16S rRNA (cytidine(1402)-2'-O)-methyltransferase, partial [Alicyclobacillus sp.]|nr:16S rRNA (cytidine(1402)-2'-O)-methyltransferase [Alicyclobacillus sp.]
MGHDLARLGARLYVCGTPIGNLADVSFRLLDTLRQADVVAAEDTRHTRKLLAYYDIHPPLLISYHEHNWRSRASDFLRWWQEGKTVALVSDAGTPGISDPGAEAVALAVEHGVPVIPVPGASALVTALSGCGFTAQPVVFLGFLPREQRAARAALAPFLNAPGVLVLYEAPHRLRATLRLLAEQWPQRPAVLGKELTKRHEAFMRGTLVELAKQAEEEEPRGEYVLVLGPLPPEANHTGESTGDEPEQTCVAEGTDHAPRGNDDVERVAV